MVVFRIGLCATHQPVNGSALSISFCGVFLSLPLKAFKKNPKLSIINTAEISIGIQFGFRKDR
jgi:hypothetical protein